MYNYIKSNLTYLAILSAIILSIVIRLSFFTNNSKNGYNASSWDALGYYMYLPGTFIYKDVKDLKWFPKIDSTYNVSGGQLYQAQKLQNGKYAFKYLGGVAIMEIPFFAIGHAIAIFSDSPSDGFSWPYQYSLMWGAVFWFFIGLLILRKVLLRYYSEYICAITIVLLVFASNLIQYVSVDGAMSHAYIFPLYSLVLWWTIRWHETFKWKYAFGIGFLIGLATISRPTELIMIFIPLLWSLDTDPSMKAKWKKIKTSYSHVFLCLLGGFVGILPQLIYWKYATGSWIYDVGSKWFFLNPWWRVLFGFEKGWFIYTPIAIFMIAGLFYLKNKPFKRAIITFTILNIWIIIAWSDWRYGASYSTRALTQSYPVLALGLAAFINQYNFGLKRLVIISCGTYLCVLNIIQILQYNTGVLHYNDMNAMYYSSIYLDLHPDPLAYSFLDTDEEIPPELLNKSGINLRSFNVRELKLDSFHVYRIGSSDINEEKWVGSDYKIRTRSGLIHGKMSIASYNNGKIMKEKKFRMAVPFAKDNLDMKYKNHFKIPEDCDSIQWRLESFAPIQIKSISLKIKLY